MDRGCASVTIVSSGLGAMGLKLADTYIQDVRERIK